MKMRNEIFEMVLEKKEVDFHFIDELVEITAQRYGFTISFYGRIEDDYKLIVDEFGRGQGHSWVGYTPTPEQEKIMARILADELQGLWDRLEDEVQSEKEAEQHRKELQDTYDFLNQPRFYY